MPPSQEPTTGNHAPPPAASTGSMLLKMVVLPGVIVLLFALTIAWLTPSDSDAASLLRKLEGDGGNRRAAAAELVRTLGQVENAALLDDPALGQRIGAILQRQIDAGGMDAESLRLRAYLCRALGELHVADPLPALVKAIEVLDLLERSNRATDGRPVSRFLKGTSVLKPQAHVLSGQTPAAGIFLA